METEKDEQLTGPRPSRDPRLVDAAADPAVIVVRSEALLAGRKELIIRHGEECYRLRLTGNNKLILTK